VSSSPPRTVVHFSDSAAFGGTERALLQILAGLDRARWRPVLFHADAPGARQLAEEAAALDVPTRAIAEAEQPSRGVASLPKLVRAFRRERASVFHAHQTWSLSCRYGIVAAALARVPARVASAQLFLEMPRLLRIDAQHALLTRCLHRHIAVSRFVAGRLRDRFGVPADRIVVIPNAVEPPRVVAPDARLRVELAGDEATPLALIVARLEAQKGLVYLVDAAAMVPDVVFAIAGEGPDRPALEARAAERGVSSRIRFLGHRRDVPSLLAIADLFVLPSLYEGFPLSVLEAMAAGVPVVATAIGGTDELVSSDTGTLVAPADPRALAEGIRALLADRDAAAIRAARARQHVLTTHSASAMVASMSALYESLLSR
jgi:glycosyltransferase involved in cell wall biosynthesis